MPFTAGLPETGCGAGSTISYTTSTGLRDVLPSLLRELEVQTLLDAPCGDFNWMAQTDLSAVHYIGVDYDAEHCRSASTRMSQPFHYRPKSKLITTIDVCHDYLPCADIVLCRDFLQHLPTVLASAALDNFKTSNATWLLATSFSNEANTDVERAGKFRCLNLTKPPFNLPMPRQSIADGVGRILGLWHRTDWTQHKCLNA